MQLPVVTIPCPHTQGFGEAEEEDAGIQCGWERLGGASEVRAQCEAAGGGREEQKGRKDGAVVKGDPSAFVRRISAQDLR